MTQSENMIWPRKWGPMTCWLVGSRMQLKIKDLLSPEGTWDIPCNKPPSQGLALITWKPQQAGDLLVSSVQLHSNLSMPAVQPEPPKSGCNRRVGNNSPAYSLSWPGKRSPSGAWYGDPEEVASRSGRGGVLLPLEGLDNPAQTCITPHARMMPRLKCTQPSQS